MGGLVAKDIFKRNYFKSYSEFYLALAIANILSNSGEYLDMSGMKVDPDIIPSDMIKYYKILLNDGAIKIEGYLPTNDTLDESKTYIDTSYFDLIPLWQEGEDCLDWSVDYAKENYGVYSGKFLNLAKLGYTLVHMVAKHVVNVVSEKTRKKLVIHFNSEKTKSTFLYVNIYSCRETVLWLQDYIELDIDFTNYKVDLDYSMFCNNGKVAGHHKLLSISDKIKLLEKYGMVEGSVLALWRREGMCENNEFGHISGVDILRLDEIGDTFLGVTIMSISKTKEEVRQDYFDIDPNIRHIFVDMLDKKPYQKMEEIDICGIGVDDYFLDEDRYITRLDESEMVDKLITIDGKTATVRMSGVDAIYWLLCQYGLDFDKDLFIDMYFHGKEPLWDKYN